MESSLNHIPAEVENVKLALLHMDLGLHNMIFSASPTPTLNGVIDWEFVDHAPPLIAVPTLIEPTFELCPSESGELRQAFWDEIPLWKQEMELKGSQIFLDLYSFGFYLKADALPDSKVDSARRNSTGRRTQGLWKDFLKNGKCHEFLYECATWFEDTTGDALVLV